MTEARHFVFSFLYCCVNKLNLYSSITKRRSGKFPLRGAAAVCLENLEKFLQLEHELPVGLDQIVSEVVFAGVDALPRDLKREEKMRDE